MSLKEVIVDVHIYDEGSSNDLRKKIHDYGWINWKNWSMTEEDEYADYEYYLEMKREKEREDKA